MNGRLSATAIVAVLLGLGVAAAAEDDMSNWYPFRATGLVTDGSVISMADWLPKPAGAQGRPAIEGEQMVVAGKPVKFWGINNNYAENAPPKDVADGRARFYAKYGINLVRLHKFFENAIGSPDSVTQFNPELLDRFDYYLNRLRENGVYYGFSGTFHFAVRPSDKPRIKLFDEMFEIVTDDEGQKRVRPGATSLIYWPGDVQDLYIEQMVTLLRHRNPYSGSTYAEDPALLYVEMINEANIYWYATSKELQRSKTFKKHICTLFCDWLRKKYGSQEKVAEAWGKESFDCCPDVGFADESLAANNIYPNPHISDRKFHARRLDSVRFLFEVQNAFYGKCAAAFKAAGFKGPLISSNWIAGVGVTHYHNLLSDAMVGIVDRHNYHKGQASRDWRPVLGPFSNASMLAVPGSSMLSSGMLQVAGRPFLLSEWIHEFPSESTLEGFSIIAAYGMGLQGWDLSTVFSQTSGPGMSATMSTAKWDATKANVITLFPALAREIYRGDVREGNVVGRLCVSKRQLAAGEFDFKDSSTHVHDVKSYSSDKVPSEALAVGRVVVDFVDRERPTEAVDVAQYERGGALRSETGQLAWYRGKDKISGYITINTPGTKAAVGFLPDRGIELGDVRLRCQTPFAAMYLTALEQKGEIAHGKTLLLTAVARARNTGMKFNADGTELLDFGKAPVLMEPVVAELKITRPGKPRVELLDHEGCPTGKTLDMTDGVLHIDGARDKTMYYLIRYEP